MEQQAISGRRAAGGLTAAALISIFSYALVNTLPSVIVNEVVDAFSLTGTSQGLMSSMINLGLMLALVTTPLIQGRVGKLTMLLLAGVLQGVMLAVGGSATGFALYLVACVLIGMGCGWTDSYANSCIVDVHKADGPKFLGFLHGLFGIGSLLTPLLVRWLLGVSDWRGVHYALAGFAGLSMCAVLALALRTKRLGGVPATEEQPLRLRDVTDYLKRKRNLLMLVAGMLGSATQNALLVWIVRYMTVRFDAAALGTVSITVYWICATVNRFCVSGIRMKPLRLFVLGCGLGAVFICGGVAANSAVAMCVASGAFGLVTGHFMPVMLSECAIGYEGKTTMTTSVMLFAMSVVRIFVPLAMAFLSTSISFVAGMLLPAAIALLAALFGVLAERAQPN